MGAQIGKIAIVGGGTAGWMAALMLQNGLKTGKAVADPVEITLIESPNAPTIGVGEATVPAMPRTLSEAGIDEPTFFRTCNASFKLGVLFANWNVDSAGKQIDFVNPFTHNPPLGGVDLAEYFLRYGAGEMNFTEAHSPAVALAKAFKGPRPLGARRFDNPVGFAYHLDAGRFAGMLKEMCKARGVVHILDDMTDVEIDEKGHVAALQLKERGRHTLDFVIDCTGFRGLIIQKALGEPFIDYSRYLANDRALAVQLPHPRPGRLEPMTRSTALGAGWAWRVPLFNRVGTGYVFSSAHRTDDAAMDEFKAHLGDWGKDAEPRVIPMRVGRSRRAWVGNCLALGLSGGFIEPLESTAIFMIDQGVRWLLQYFPDREMAPALRDRYNALSDSLYDEVRDFVCMHYRLGNRADTQYWTDAREALDLPDSLEAKLDLWRHKLPGRSDFATTHLFGPWTHQIVLLGKRAYDEGGLLAPGPVGSALDVPRDRWRAYLRDYRKKSAALVAAFADHRMLLRELRGEMPTAVQRGGGGARRATPAAAAPVFAGGDEASLL